ncbi:MAG: DUF5723 family protein [Bacteroidetes bacterium]|nr:DUF5723 family protein [Bacteroidota bacterium]
MDRKNNVAYLLGLLCLLMVRQACFSQETINLAFLRSVPQSNKINPASEIPYDWWMGIPALSSFHVGFNNSGFRYKDVLYKTADDSLRVNVEGFLNSLDKINDLSVEMQTEILGFGFHANEYYFELRMSERFSSSFVYSKDLMSFLLKLNGQFIDKKASFSGTGLNASYFHEISMGVSRDYDERLTVGARFKFLSGVHLQSILILRSIRVFPVWRLIRLIP